MGELEAESVQTNAELASTPVRLDAAVIGKSDGETVMRGFANEPVSTFSNAAAQLNSSFLVRFGKGAKSAFSSVHQKCLVTISPGCVVQEVMVT